MAVVQNWLKIDSGSPALFLKIEYDYYRSGNNMYYDVYVRMGCIESSSGAYRNNRWATRIKVNGDYVETNGTVKPRTSSAIGSTVYTYSKKGIAVPINSGTVALSVEIADTGFSTNWSVSKNWGTRGYGMATINPVAPSAPASVSIPGSIAPDKTASNSWSTSSGGTNGVGGYEVAWSKNGGSSWSYVDVGYTHAFILNLNSNGFVHGSVLRLAVRSYTTVNGVRYYSSYTYSGNTKTLFIAPGAPGTLALKTQPDGQETIQNMTYRATYKEPGSGGSNGIGGYAVQWLKNGSNFGAEIDVGNVLLRDITTTEGTINVDDNLSFKVRAYTIGQGNKYYSGYLTSGTIKIISDKFIFVSLNGGAFNKYKMFISVNGGTFKEVKKEKFKTVK